MIRFSRMSLLHVRFPLGLLDRTLTISATQNWEDVGAFIDKNAGFLQYGNLLAIPYRIVTAMGNAGWLFRGEVVWLKSRPLPEGICRRPHRRHEGIYIFAKSERHAFRVKPPVGSVWELKQTPNKLPHCSTFPFDLPLHCIKASALEPGAVVCDPFMGSGTTARAARSLGFGFIGFELEQAMCNIANSESMMTAKRRLGSDRTWPETETTRDQKAKSWLSRRQIADSVSGEWKKARQGDHQ